MTLQILTSKGTNGEAWRNVTKVKKIKDAEGHEETRYFFEDTKNKYSQRQKVVALRYKEGEEPVLREV